MKEEKTTPLRQRMIEDMRIRGMGEKAQPTSSFAASLFMSCPMGSTASGITACSPAPPARQTSRRSAPCSGRHKLRLHLRLKPDPPPPHSPCANRALAAAVRCGSSRSFAVGNNRDHGHHHGSRRHAETPVTLADQPLVPVQALGRVRLPWTAQSAGNGLGTHPSRADCTDISCRKLRVTAAITPWALAGYDRGGHRRRSFPIASATAPAASSLGGLPTRAVRAPSRTLTPRPASENLHQSRR